MANKKKAKELRTIPSMDDNAVSAWVNDTPSTKVVPPGPQKTKSTTSETKNREKGKKEELVAITYYAPKEHAQAFRLFAFQAERSRSSIIFEEMEKFLARQK